MTFIFKEPVHIYVNEQGNGNSALFYMAKKKITFILTPILDPNSKGLRLPSLEFLQVPRPVCHVFWGRSPWLLPCSGFLSALHFSSAAQQTQRCCSAGEALGECHCGFQGAHFCAHEGRPSSPRKAWFSFLHLHSARLSITYNRPQSPMKRESSTFQILSCQSLYTAEIKTSQKKTSNTFQTHNDPNPCLGENKSILEGTKGKVTRQDTEIPFSIITQSNFSSEQSISELPSCCDL